MPHNNGYSVNMRQDKRTGEHLAVVPTSYGPKDARYYMALCESDGCWAELSPEYLTKATRTVTTFPGWLKRNMDGQLGYILNLAPRIYG